MSDYRGWAGATPGPVCWIDARMGIAGDMLAAALIDAGAPLAALQAAVDAVLPATVTLQVTSVLRGGLRATRLQVTSLRADHPHRHWTDIQAMLSAAELPEPVRAGALAVFARIASAEARVHGVDAQQVHFHEVGAWDSIADIVAGCAGMHELGVSRVIAGPVALGSGTIHAAHGEIPVPVPAVLELARGWQVHNGGDGELATPTGLALATTLAGQCTELPAMTVRAVGVGAGTRDVPGRPNVVRVILGDQVDAGTPEIGEEVVIAANVDDLDPRVWPSVLAELLAAGANDAWLTPILMKKGRPAHTLSVLCQPAAAAELRTLIFQLVPTLGVRETTVRKHALARSWRTVEIAGQPVRIKIGELAGEVTTATPEYEDVEAAAATLGIPVREVMARAIAASRQS